MYINKIFDLPKRIELLPLSASEFILQIIRECRFHNSISSKIYDSKYCNYSTYANIDHIVVEIRYNFIGGMQQHIIRIFKMKDGYYLLTYDTCYMDYVNEELDMYISSIPRTKSLYTCDGIYGLMEYFEMITNESKELNALP